jgi:Aldehyde dehydrogenase family
VAAAAGLKTPTLIATPGDLHALRQPHTPFTKLAFQKPYDPFIKGKSVAPVKGQQFDVVTPISILVLTELIVGPLPPGVLDIVNVGGKQAGLPLASSNRIGKIAFTGITVTGRVIAHAAFGS